MSNVIAPKSTRHPSDISPADNRITVQELTAYALAWKTGKDWSIGPNPIPQNYVTRAGEIWRRGETYTYDPAQGPAPLWWVPKQSATLLTLDSGVVARDKAETEWPGRALRSLERLGNSDHIAYLVTLNIVPKSGVNVGTVEENPPAGWTISDVSDDGVFDNAGGRIRWESFWMTRREHLLIGSRRLLTADTTTPYSKASLHSTASDVPLHSDVKADPSEGHAFGKLKNIHRHASGECDVSFSVAAGHQYKMQVSTDLRDWVDLGLLVNETGEIQMLDTDAADSSIRYYRAILSE